ncbi:MAG: alkylation response protein AidB-like acyl-CoA dehydrogenase [Paracrocinitomix sp.]|jgi:alkylation response protein AidB-like acyl-CoA dehydrogenase
MTMIDARDRVRELEPLIREHADAAEQQRFLPNAVADAMAHAGLYRIGASRSIGGEELDPMSQIEVIEVASQIDGATGWNLMIGIEVMGLFGAALEPDVAHEIYSDPGLVAAGALNPQGRAVRVDGGYRVTGQWPFASGCHNAHWFWGQCIVTDGHESIMDAAGNVELLEATIPFDDFEIIDTWHVAGMRGSGSHDVAVADVFVPDRFITRTAAGGPAGMRFMDQSPLYRFPSFARLAYNKVGVSTGIAKAALDSFKTLATEKKPRASRTLLGEKPSTQMAYAKASMLLRSSRAYVMDAVGDVWDTILAGDEPTAEQRMHVHLACTSAAETAVRVVELLHTTAGTTANFQDCPLERQLRNVRVVPQHIMVSSQWNQTAGRVLLGLPGDSPWFNG